MENNKTFEPKSGCGQLWEKGCDYSDLAVKTLVFWIAGRFW